MICALIMAGGRGTRFWPMSTEDKPKQFLKLLNDQTMIQLTVSRLLKIIPIEQVFVVTGEKYKDLTIEQLPELPKENIIIEPVGRNTAPCVLLSALRMNEKYGDANMIVLPSDALITEVDQFIDVIKSANHFLNINQESVVTIGITPTRPEINYGYIKQTPQIALDGDYPVIKVEKFVEKPNLEKAVRYLNDGNYLWNAGMFVWKVQYILALAKAYMPETYQLLTSIGRSTDEGYSNKLNNVYPKVKNISVDYAIMEKIDTIYVVPGNFGWDDVGTWMSLERYLPKDEFGNATKGKIYTFDAKGNIIFSNEKNIILLGINDIFCIESEDMIILGNKEQLKTVHLLKDKLSED